MRARVAIFICVITISLGLLIWRYKSAHDASKAPASDAQATPAEGEGASPASLAGPTKVYAHNLMLRKGPNFRVYVRWLRGEMVRTRKDVNPSFDDPDSFVLDIKAGVLRENSDPLRSYAHKLWSAQRGKRVTRLRRQRALPQPLTPEPCRMACRFITPDQQPQRNSYDANENSYTARVRQPC